MKKFTTLFLLAGIIAIAACSDKAVRAIQITQTDEAIAAKKWPDYTSAKLADGKALFEKTCNQCHALKNPKSRDEAGWNKILPVMAHKAKIDAASQDLILKYVVTMSIAGK